MRAIKFRGKTELTSEWVYGFYTMGSLVHVEHPEKDERIVPRYLIDDGLLHDVIPETIGQFTGLTDRKGCEVYEGDILVVTGIKHPRYHIVSWDERKFMFLLGDTPLYVFLRGDTLLREYTVVGNVFDNPELLKGGDK